MVTLQFPEIEEDLQFLERLAFRLFDFDGALESGKSLESTILKVLDNN
jgi:hypothetical protein